MLLVFTIAASLQQVAWRATRGAQAQWDAQRGNYAADADVVHAIADWRPDSVAATPIGTPLVRHAALPDGWQIQTTIVRTGPLRAVILSIARRTHRVGIGAGDPTAIRKLVSRAVPLVPPPFPSFGAATMLGSVTLGAAALDGRDSFSSYNAARDDCGAQRDTNSVAALSAPSITIRGAPRVQGATLVTTAAPLAIAHAQFDSAFALLLARAPRSALSVGLTVPPQNAWRALVIRDTGAVTLQGTSAHVGLLAIDGDLVLRGTLEVDGVLIVRGALDAAQGALTVRGALIVRDVAARASTMGDSVSVRYAPCMVGRALAAVALPRASRYAVYNSP